MQKNQVFIAKHNYKNSNKIHGLNTPPSGMFLYQTCDFLDIVTKLIIKILIKKIILLLVLDYKLLKTIFLLLFCRILLSLMFFFTY